MLKRQYYWKEQLLHNFREWSFSTASYEVEVFETSRLDLQEGREQVQSALRRFDGCWQANDWPEAEPVKTTDDDDPLRMDFMLPKAAVQQRGELPVGELAL